MIIDGEKRNGDFKALSAGIIQVKRFIFLENYHLDRAIIDASKAAYVATAIKFNVTKLEKYPGIDAVKDLVIDSSFDSKLNKLKKGNAEAFFYWFQISKLRVSH